MTVRPGTRGPIPMPLLVRIARHVVIVRNGCHIWQGSLGSKGYPHMQVGSTVDGTRRPRRVHRVLWDELHGELPDGHVIHHTCEDKRCVNPAHLQLMTVGEHSDLHDSATKARAGRTTNFASGSSRDGRESGVPAPLGGAGVTPAAGRARPLHDRSHA
jgi:HNH endonuclease